VADVVLTGEVFNDFFGISVSSAGDVNGDGYADVIVGTINNDAGGTDAGRAYIYYGGASMDNLADVVLTGEAAEDYFGFSVAAAADLNGDGYGDVIVGARGNDVGGTQAGRAYVFYGGASMDNLADVVLTGEAAGDLFGYSVSSAGDVNGDGFADVIIGANGNDAGGSSAGRAYVYYGGASMDAAADIVLTGEAAGDQFGGSVSGAGDVNEDGYADVIAGAIGNDARGTDAGRAYVFYGGATMDNLADVVMTGEAAGDFFGNVSSMGDINGDMYADVVVGAFGNDAGGSEASRAYVYTGGASMDNVADIVMTGEAAGDTFGSSVSGAGDVNGDGYADMLVGAPLNDTNGIDAGRAYLYLNSLRGTDLADAFFTGEGVSDLFAYSVSGAGDVNGDGYEDFIVGAPYADTNGSDAGRAYVYYGGVASIDVWADVVLNGAAAGDLFGYSVSGAGDVNGDGYDDVVVGAIGSDVGGSNAGRAYVYYGGASMNNIVDVFLTGEATSDQFGESVSSAGDVNGDGYDDVIVGAKYNDAAGSNAGRAYVFYGGSFVDSGADIVLTGVAAGEQFGISVSRAGDVNGDGYADVVVGASLNSVGGQAYVYHGGSPMNTGADLVLKAEATSDYFGYSVSSAGDVNGDGYDDLIVGAYRNDAGGAEAGRAYVYYGGAAMNNGVDLTLTGEASGDQFGYSVSSAGDVNGDGYADVIVGANGNDAVESNAGRAYVHYGGAAMDNAADVFLTGTAAIDLFGASVSSAGDVNGDGYADVIVGAYRNDVGGTDAGRAYLYLSSPTAVIPRITTITDVAGDQGGWASVRWSRSGYDIRGLNRVTAYRIERSEPPDQNGFNWEALGERPASWNPFYSYVAPTYSDQTEGNSGTTFFRITALGANVDERWFSAFASGASIDNLAPLTPQNPGIQQTAPETITLNWNENTTDPDVFGYTLYRSTTDGFEISDSTRLAETTSITYTDNAATGSQPYFYRLTTKDVHGNESPPTDQLAALTFVNLKVFLTGPYVPGGTLRTDLKTAGLIPLEQPYGNVEYLDTPSAYTGEEMLTTLPEGAVDWVLVEVRSGTAATDSLTTRAALLMSDGHIRDLDGSGSLAFGSLAEGSYYVVVRHRNHLAVMSSVPVLISATVPSLYDFTTSASQAFGAGAMVEVEAGVWALYSGDGDASGGITASDQALWLAQNGLNGYQVGDYNLSGGSTASDQALWLTGNGLNSQVPE